MKRTHTCGELTIKNINNKVTLQGWIKKIRKMGAMTFIDLRDMYGITQLIINDSTSIANLDLKNEFVIEVKGTVIERKSKNQDMITGEIEIEVENITVINQAELTPFQIENDIEVLEDTRLKYRYLDIRRLKMKDNLVLRSKVYSAIRSFMNDNAFLEIETPFFGKSTPEGARDFLVPSRINKNKFYALPQSPQLYKQLFMVAGIDRYYQIARCFRDEDLRIDRQLEFTQLDLEMNFSTGDDVMIMVEKLIKYVLKETKQIDISEPLLKLPYSDAIKYYGSDKPDLRYDLKIHDLNDIFKDTQVKLLQKENSSIRGIMIDEVLMKKQLEELNETANQNQFQTLAFAKFESNVWSGSIASSLSETEKQAILKEFNIADKGTLLIQTGEYNQISQMMGAIRVNLSKMFNLANKDEYKLLWVTDFPLFEYNDEEKRYVAAHHPFTMPAVESLDNFDKDKANAKAFAYDLVMNGFELGGGSQRITNIDIQQRMFDAVGLSKETIDANFGWFTNAYKYGAPYHAGFAWGMDRLIMLLTQSESIRDVIAFPKNSSGVDPMTNAPDFVANHQLEELNIKIK